MELDELRKRIDEQDQVIIRAFRERMALCGGVAAYKKERGLPILDSGREEEKLSAVSALAGREYGDYAREVYGEIMRVSRSLQKSRTGVFGLLGGKLGHSYSPQIHKMFGGYDYALFERAPEELEEFFRQAPFDGINVTIPYKKAVIPFCGELSDAAARIGSVNTIIKLPDGTLRGQHRLLRLPISCSLRRHRCFREKVPGAGRRWSGSNCTHSSLRPWRRKRRHHLPQGRG